MAFIFENLHRLFEKLEQLLARPEGERLDFSRELEEEFPGAADYIAVSMKMRMPLTHVVVPIHGIRDDGAWADGIRRALARHNHIVVSPGGYGYFPVWKFLASESARGQVYEHILRTLRNAQGHNQVVSVICHSFGTYGVTRAIIENPDIRLFRLIMCGSIVPQEFAWDKVPATLPLGRIVNDCGNRDNWPVVARRLNSRFGATGRFGFAHAPVIDRWHDVDHGGFASTQMIEEYWAPFLARGKLVESLQSFQKPGLLLNALAGRLP